MNTSKEQSFFLSVRLAFKTLEKSPLKIIKKVIKNPRLYLKVLKNKFVEKIPRLALKIHKKKVPLEYSTIRF